MSKILPSLDEESEDKLLNIIKSYKGQATTLESAIGALVIGEHYGWRVLKIVHNPSTYKKYESILGISFQEVLPERTDKSRRSIGLKIADNLNSFWSVVTGKNKVENKGNLEDDLKGEQS